MGGFAHDALTRMIATVRDEFPDLPSTGIVVRVVAGPDAGAELTLASTKLVVGSSPTASLVLTDRRVSRRHVALSIEPAGIRVLDLGSTNGTFVHGVRVSDAWAQAREPIVVGETTLLAESVAAASEDEADGFGRMVGSAPAMRRLFALGQRLAASDIPVLIEGETGTGKELFAEEIHRHGPRHERPFVVVDAFADDPQHGAAALFGAAPGVFGSIPEGRRGLLESAEGGTLLLDRPGELSADLQRRLARALARREIVRVGSDVPIAFDARILTTSSVDLDALVERGALREDLFFALAGARIEIPPLRERPHDIPALIRHFAGGASLESFVGRCLGQPWPGNVRELEHAVARHLAIGDVSVPAPPPATDLVASVLAQRYPLARARQEIVEAFERLYVAQVLDDHGGSVTRAARASGLAHRYFQALKARRGF